MLHKPMRSSAESGATAENQNEIKTLNQFYLALDDSCGLRHADSDRALDGNRGLRRVLQGESLEKLAKDLKKLMPQLSTKELVNANRALMQEIEGFIPELRLEQEKELRSRLCECLSQSKSLDHVLDTHKAPTTTDHLFRR